MSFFMMYKSMILVRNGLPLLKESFSKSDEGCVSSGRVMSFIEKSVARLDQLERLETLALELGKSHYRYNAPPKYYGVNITSNTLLCAWIVQRVHPDAFLSTGLKIHCNSVSKHHTDPNRHLLCFSVQFVPFVFSHM